MSVGDIENENLQVSIYPNPTNDFLNVSFQTISSENIELEIYDISGRLILNEKQRVGGGRNVITKDITGLSEAVYFVNLKVGETLYTIRFIKIE
jgi:hypothetical protein